MTYNPCGKGVDWGRRSYKTTVRPFSDSAITTQIVWYPAKPVDGPLPFPSHICSLDWSAEPPIRDGVGEVYGTDRDFVFKKPLGPVPGNHVCGSEDDFRHGARIADGKPVLTYLPSGLPTCCDPGRREAVVLLRVDPVTRLYRERVYRSTVPLRVVINTRTVRSNPYRSSTSVTVRCQSTTVRSDPYHSTAVARVVPVTRTVRSDPFHSTAIVRVVPVTDANTGPPGETCTQFVAPGAHTFTAVFTGNHRIQCWGASGGGDDSSIGGGMNLGGGGGGGGAYSEVVSALVAGTSYEVTVGPGGDAAGDGGDSRFQHGVTLLCLAAGGHGATANAGGPGGLASAGIGAEKWSGGIGADGQPESAGGGGGGCASASPDGGTTPGDGGDGDNAAGGSSLIGGVGGDPGATDGEDGHAGEAPGGGGGGGQADGGAGGDGAHGLVVICWPVE